MINIYKKNKLKNTIKGGIIFMTKKSRKVKAMTTSAAMLEAIKQIRKDGISEQRNMELLKKSGITNNKGEIISKYKGIISIKETK